MNSSGRKLVRGTSDSPKAAAIQASSIELTKSSTTDFCAAPAAYSKGDLVEVYWPGPDSNGVWSPGTVLNATWSTDDEQSLYDINVQPGGSLNTFVLNDKPHHEIRVPLESKKKKNTCWAWLCRRALKRGSAAKSNPEPGPNPEPEPDPEAEAVPDQATEAPLPQNEKKTASNSILESSNLPSDTSREDRSDKVVTVNNDTARTISL